MSENGEPHTPAEEAQERVERTLRDGWLAIRETERLRNDPVAGQFTRTKEAEAELLSMKHSIDRLVS